jgi:hypothetical protein
MGNRAEGTFDLDSWDAGTPYDEHEGTQLARVKVGKTFRGGLTGTSTAELITVVTEAGPVAYVGIERFEGTLEGRAGGFVLQHNAGARNGEPWLSWKIAEGSGTGDLDGITGEGEIIIGPDGAHSYTLDYRIG